jgi:hypothetical protein
MTTNQVAALGIVYAYQTLIGAIFIAMAINYAGHHIARALRGDNGYRSMADILRGRRAHQ